MTKSTNILAKSAGLDRINYKDNIKINVDFCLINDGKSSQAVDFICECDSLFSNKKTIVAIDHDTPSGSVEASALQRKLLNFAKKYDTFIYNGHGIGYHLMLDNHLKDNQIVVCSGVHTSTMGATGALSINVTPEVLSNVIKTGYMHIEVPDVVKVELSGKLQYGVQAKDLMLHIIKNTDRNKFTGKVIEFCGSSLNYLSLEEKTTLCNLAGETGAISALINANETSDDGYSHIFKYDLSLVSAMIVLPDSYNEITVVEELSSISVNEVFIGGCTGGGIEDLRVAADILKGKKVSKGVRLMIAPKTSAVYINAIDEGLITIFINAGAIVMNQGCSVCYGKSQGIVDDGEVLVSAGSYNLRGCAGSDKAKVFIVSAKTAATIAINGKIKTEGKE